jgi:hypothetical protein
MKRSLIFLLAAGPLFVFGQRLDQLRTFRSFQFSAPGPGRSDDTAFFKRPLTGSGRPVRLLSVLPVLPVRILFPGGFAAREMPPDRMPCLVPLRMPEQMPMSLRGNRDPLPNAERRPFMAGRWMYRKRTLVLDRRSGNG